MITMTGATKKSHLSAWAGVITSLKISLTASAIGCSRPNGPTRFGPMRMCIQPMSLRSQYVRYATHQQDRHDDRHDPASDHTTGQRGAEGLGYPSS